MYIYVCACVRVCVRVCVCVSLCVRVCMCEIQVERVQKVRVYMSNKRTGVCVCVKVKRREREYVCLKRR